MKNLVKLSKMLSYALRHNPAEFGLTLDEDGWVHIPDLLDTLHGLPEFRDATLLDLKMIETTSDKKRFDLDEANDKIRAYYGHSISQNISYKQSTPPEYLYHGTSPDAAEIILSEGLKPMNRQKVHLSTDLHTARKTGRRKHPEPAILKIASAQASVHGIRFFIGNQDIWLSDQIPAEYIEKFE